MGTYTQQRKMKLTENSPQFIHDVIADGDIAEALDRANNPVVTHLFFSALAVQVQSAVRKAGVDKKDASKNWGVKKCQTFSNEQRGKIGVKGDPIKRKERALSEVKSGAALLTDAELKEMGLSRVAS